MKTLCQLVLQYKSDVEQRIECLKEEMEIACQDIYDAEIIEEICDDYRQQIAHWQATLYEINEEIENNRLTFELDNPEYDDKMRYYELEFTEFNGEQHYTYQYLFRAKGEYDAKKNAKIWLTRWYDDEDAEWTDENTCEFFAGCNVVSINHISPTTREEFAAKQVQRFSFNC